MNFFLSAIVVFILSVGFNLADQPGIGWLLISIGWLLLLAGWLKEKWG